LIIKLASRYIYQFRVISKYKPQKELSTSSFLINTYKNISFTKYLKPTARDKRLADKNFSFEIPQGII